MKRAPTLPCPESAKSPTGIAGLDDMTGGGLPRGRTTLLAGGPGSGKTILSLQFLIHGARHCKEAGIFIAFEELSTRIVTNAAGFQWNIGELQSKNKLYFLDAQPAPDLILSGNFDLSGMLAVLAERIKAMKAKRIVIDALDIVLALLPDDVSRRREIYRLHEWLLVQDLTAIITAKASGDARGMLVEQSLGFMQFMVDCSICLNHGLVCGVSQRNIRIQKYRGSMKRMNHHS